MKPMLLSPLQAVALAAAARALATAPRPALAAPPVGVAPAPSFVAADAVAGDRLSRQRGGTVTTHVEQSGGVSEATARHVVTGANSVRDGSFAAAAGLTTVIQNSGANVLIQNSMTVNVQLK